MLKTIRERHSRKILWMLAIIIIVAFVFGYAIRYTGDRKNNIAGKIGNRKILLSEVEYYTKISKLSEILFPLNNGKRLISSLIYQKNPGGYLLLLWKANQENIKISDEEIVKVVREWFSTAGQFDKERYERFVSYVAGIGQPRVFEEHIRNFLKIDKLYGKYLDLKITDNELREAYKKENQKAKIAYIFFPYENFKDTMEVPDSEISEFYGKNKELFKPEPMVSIKYILINKDDENKEKIIEASNSVQNLNELIEKFPREVKTTGFFGLKDPIEGLGWQPHINQLAFSLKKGAISRYLTVKEGIVFIEKAEEKQSSIPTLEEIKNKIKEQIQDEKSRKKTGEVCETYLKRIHDENIADLKVFSETEKITFKETDYFKNNDYIEGLGMNKDIGDIIFSLQEKVIYSRPIVLPKGAYIIQLLDLTDADQKDFDEKKELYHEFLYRLKLYTQESKFLSQLEKEAKLQLYLPEKSSSGRF